MEAVKDKTDVAKCYFCGCLVGDEGWCYGCSEYICESCYQERDEPPLRKHSVEDHKKQ